MLSRPQKEYRCLAELRGSGLQFLGPDFEARQQQVALDGYLRGAGAFTPLYGPGLTLSRGSSHPISCQFTFAHLRRQ